MSKINGYKRLTFDPKRDSLDVYLINGDVYFREFTFFTGAFLHTRICNNILGLIWKINPDNLNKNKKSLENEVKKCIPKYYNLDFIK